MLKQVRQRKVEYKLHNGLVQIFERTRIGRYNKKNIIGHKEQDVVESYDRQFSAGT